MSCLIEIVKEKFYSLFQCVPTKRLSMFFNNKRCSSNAILSEFHCSSDNNLEFSIGFRDQWSTLKLSRYEPKMKHQIDPEKFVSFDVVTLQDIGSKSDAARFGDISCIEIWSKVATSVLSFSGYICECLCYAASKFISSTRFVARYFGAFVATRSSSVVSVRQEIE